MESTDTPPGGSRVDLRQLDDADVVGRIVERDSGALAELYDRYSGLLTALAHRVLGNASDA